MEDEKTIPIQESPEDPRPAAEPEDLPLDNPPPIPLVKAKKPAKKPPSRKKRAPVVALPIKPEKPVKPAKTPAPPALPPGRPLRASLYRKIAAVFIALTMVVIGFVLYLTLSRATIKVTLRTEPVRAEELVTVTASPGEGKREVAGKAVEISLEKTATIPISGDGAVVSEKAYGTVTLINLAGRDQPLVATTRLLSEGGVLFRLKQGVVVPKGGRIEAAVAADQPGKQGEIGPSKFTIPGLAAALQDKIYAVSTAAMIGGERTVKALSQADIDAAYKMVEDELKGDAETKLRAAAGDAGSGGGAIAELTVSKRSSDGVVGKEASAVTVTVGVRAVGVFYDADELAALMAAELAAGVPGDRALVGAPGAPTITIEKTDAAAGTAIIAVRVEGAARITSSSDIFDKERLAGLSRAEAARYFAGFPAVESIDIKFRPPFLRRIPRLKDHIDIIIN